MKVRAHLALMAAAILVPVVALSAVALGMLLDAERAAARRGVQESASLISLAVDQELAAAESALRALATSAYLQRDDFASFYQQAIRARTSESSWILLYAPNGQQLVNTRLPYGTALPVRSDPHRTEEVLKSGRPSVSNLYLGTDLRQHLVTVDVPVDLGGGQRYVIAQAFRPQHFKRAITDRALSPEWIIGIFDRNHITLVRSHREDDFVGKAGGQAIREAAKQSAAGIIRHSSREGVAIYDAYTRSPRSGWVVAIGVPVDAIEAPARRAVLVAGLGVLGALGMAIGVAFLIARRLNRSIALAAQSALALGHGQTHPARQTGIDEIDSVHAALAEAGVSLESEKDARARAEAERARLLASEHAARELAEAQNRAKDEFLAMLGHELRNPLAAIKGAATALESHRPDEKQWLRAREVISRQAQHLSRVVDDLLDLSRVMTGKILLEREPVELGEAVHSSVATLRAAGRTDRHTLEVSGEPVWIDADATRLDQIITNLLTNALKYTPDHGRIEIAIGTAGDDAVLTVRDSGIGISRRLLPQVFDVFVQGDASLDRARGGLGLGLALVRRIAMLHGGSAEAASEGPGRGSTFTVRLPRILVPPATAAPATKEKSNENRRRVLVVDDHEDARTMLTLLLRLAGHEPLEARDGLEGVQVATAEKPDVAIVDIGLPGIDGYEVARRLRSDPATRTLLLIALTGYGQDEDRRRALEAGFDLHVVKPVDPDRLMEAIAGAGRSEG